MLLGSQIVSEPAVLPGDLQLFILYLKQPLLNDVGLDEVLLVFFKAKLDLSDSFKALGL